MKQLQKEAMENIVPIGRSTSTQAGLYLYLDVEHPFAYYCIEESYKGDIRFPRATDNFFKYELKESEGGETLDNPLKIAKRLYSKLRNFEITDELVKSTPSEIDAL